MGQCLKKIMTTHKYFREAIAGFLVRKKSQKVQDYMDYIVQPQVPIDEIAIVLLAHMWKVHVCILIEGKYWTTKMRIWVRQQCI